MIPASVLWLYKINVHRESLLSVSGYKHSFLHVIKMIFVYGGELKDIIFPMI